MAEAEYTRGMHVVIDARESGTSTGRYVDKLIEHMHALQPKHRITLITKPHRVAFLQDLAPNFSVAQTAVKEFGLGEQITFKQQIERLKPDLVHFAMVQQPVLYRGRVVTTMHDLTTARFRNPAKNSFVFWIKQRVYIWANRRVARKSLAIFTPSEFVKKDVAAFCCVSPEKIVVTLEAAEPITDTAVPIAALEGEQFIMYTGRPTPHKNLERLISAHAQLRLSHPELLLVLVGKKDANYERHAENVRREGLEGVVFTGFVQDGELRWLYENCTAYVFPSLSEGFGLPGLEAMAHGAPVVSSNATCLPEIYGDAAEYFDPHDVADMAAKISGVVDDTAKRSSLIQAGHRRVSKFSWDRMALQTLDQYEKSGR